MFDDMSYDEIENMIDNIVDSDEFDKISEDFFKSIISSDDSKFNFSKKQTTIQLNENYENKIAYGYVWKWRCE